MSYFVITSGEDGIDIDKYEDRAAVERAVDGQVFSKNAVYLDRIPQIAEGQFRIDFDGVVIIKGEIVMPSEKTKVTQWEVP